MNTLSRRTRLLILAVGVVLLAGSVIGYVRFAAPDGRPNSGAHTAAVQQVQGQADLGGGDKVRFLTNGRLSLAAKDRPDGPRVVTAEQCDRSYAQAGTVACLRPVDPFVGTRLVVFDPELREKRSIELTGFPNRLRVSPSGRMVGWTLFVDGHSYSEAGFSTSTGILDTETGTAIRSLEEFSIVKDGKPYQAVDMNFWGVTFVDDNRFYATMSTAGHRYLVAGDIAARQMRTLAEDVECPSLSPDGTRIAFKHTIAAAVPVEPPQVTTDGHDHASKDEHAGDTVVGPTWRLSTLDLATMKITPLAETRSVDDQAAWLDGNNVAYVVQRADGVNDMWTVPADGTGTPRMLMPEASSLAP